MGSGDDREPPEITINSTIDPRFSIEGNGDSVLIINVFAPELNGSVVYCRDQDLGDIVASFALMSTRMLKYTSLHSALCVLLCVCVYASVLSVCVSIYLRVLFSARLPLSVSATVVLCLVLSSVYVSLFVRHFPPLCLPHSPFLSFSVSVYFLC